MYELMSEPSGRVLRYYVDSNSTEVVLDGIAFANGIVLSPEEDYLLVS